MQLEFLRVPPLMVADTFSISICSSCDIMRVKYEKYVPVVILRNIALLKRLKTHLIRASKLFCNI